jgi:uncharacterized delta-60 repeat protein
VFYKVLIQPDGKIVCAGWGSVSHNYFDFLLYRFNVNGTPDSTFGKNGISSIDFSHTVDFLHDCLLKPGGRFISVGDEGYGGVLEMAETGSAGHLVKEFGTNGEIITADSASLIPYKLAIQSNGRLLVESTDTSDKTRFLAFTSNGVIDSAFGTNGIFELPQERLYTSSICVQDDDKIIGAGQFNKTAKLCVYRLLPNGKLDPSFGERGIFKLQGGAGAGASDVLILKNKKILVCGDQSTSNGGVILRLNNDVTFPPIAAVAQNSK